ncbi:unnamed protein product [Withania somnifera]
MEDCKLSRMNSHDCRSIWNALMEVSLFFKVLCSTVLKVEDLQKLEESIKVTVCKLEKIFPPSFFDPMEHLLIYFPYEAIVGGPVQFRWMYSSERLDKVTRNDEGEVDAPDGCLSVFLHPGRPSGEMKCGYLSDKEWDAARIYVLLNCEEIQQFILIFEDELKRNSENISLKEIDKETNSRFAKWFEAYCLKNLDSCPHKWVQTYPQYFTKGYRFNTLTYGSNKSTMNSGMCIKGTIWSDYESDYYGLLDEVIQLEYSNPTKKRTALVLLKCDWFDPTMDRGWKTLPAILPDINGELDSLCHENGEHIDAIENEEEMEESDVESSRDERDEQNNRHLDQYFSEIDDSE